MLTSSEIEAQVTASAQAYLTKKYPRTEINLQLTPINANLDLPDCSSPLSIRFPYTNVQRLTARVTCPAPTNWSIFVTGRIEMIRQAVVATQPIPRNTRITSQMLGFGRVDIASGRSDYYTQIDQVAGQTSKRAISAQQPVSAQDLAPSLLVNRGDEVILEAVRSSARISVKATALEDGRLNEQIRVKNQQSGREVVARVVGQGRVRSN